MSINDRQLERIKTVFAVELVLAAIVIGILGAVYVYDHFINPILSAL